MKRSLKWTVVTAASVGVLAAGLVGGRAWAGGIPAAGALNYSGLLQDAMGAPLTGTQYVEVKFWNDATASAATNLLCDTNTPTAISLSQGRFSIGLPDACTAAVGGSSGIWTEVFVGTTLNGVVSLGRAKIGAVPFAVEANHAVKADTATSATTAASATVAANAPIVTGWQAYMPVLTRDGGTVVANQTSAGEYRRVGDSLEVNILTNFSGAPASGGTWYQWSLPGTLAIDDARLINATSVVGGGMIGQGINNNIALITYVRSSKGVSATANGAGSYYVNDTIPIAFGNGGNISLFFTVPISGWTTTQ